VTLLHVDVARRSVVIETVLRCEWLCRWPTSSSGRSQRPRRNRRLERRQPDRLRGAHLDALRGLVLDLRDLDFFGTGSYLCAARVSGVVCAGWNGWAMVPGAASPGAADLRPQARYHCLHRRRQRRPLSQSTVTSTAAHHKDAAVDRTSNQRARVSRMNHVAELTGGRTVMGPARWCRVTCRAGQPRRDHPFVEHGQIALR